MNARRKLLVAIGAGVITMPFASLGQQQSKSPRIGYLAGDSVANNPHRLQALRDGLRELGYVEGKNLVIEYRWAEAKYDRLPELAAELVRLSVDVIVAVGDPVIFAAKQATSTTPIVMASVADPVGRGFVVSLARPGGNVTGVSNFSANLAGKWLELLKEVVPTLSTFKEQVEVGGLLSYGPKITDNFHRAASYVVKILRGANPADLPVEQPTKFELAINLKTAKALGLTIPQSLLLRADEVIQ